MSAALEDVAAGCLDVGGFLRPQKSALAEVERIKQLRHTLECCRKRIKRMKQAPWHFAEEIAHELAIAQQTYQELKRRERLFVWAEFGFE